LAWHLERFGITGELVSLDVSNRSTAIARERAASAGIGNTEFRVGAIEDLPIDGSGMFDYIDCSGILNHVVDPVAALARLARVLVPGGGMGVMAYGALGRTGVYPAQEALRLLAKAEPVTADLARLFVEGLPDENWLRKNAAFAGVANTDDVELADILLNPRDRAFSVRDLVTLFAGQGLAIRTFLPPVMYDPVPVLREPTLRERANNLSQVERWCLAELMQGTLNKHVFYAVKKNAESGEIMSLLDDPETLMIPHGMNPSALAQAVLDAGREDQPVGIQFMVDGRQRSMAVSFSVAELAIMRLIEGPTAVRTIVERLGDKIDPPIVHDALRRVVTVFEKVAGLHLMRLG